jgi:hypothetical protein
MWQDIESEQMNGRFDVQHAIPILGEHLHESLLARP